MSETQHWQDITSEVATVAVESVPTVVDVAGQVQVLTDAHNDTATRVAALEKALVEVTSFLLAHIAGKPGEPSVPVPAPAATVSSK